MKTFFLLLLLPMFASAEVTYLDCQADAETFANHERPIAPLPECAGIIDAELDKVELISGNYRIFGKGRMVFVDVRNASGVVTQRSLLAGDQTDLVSVKKFFLDSAKNRLFIIQQNGTNYELLVYALDAIGNVTPINLMRSNPLFTTASSVKVSDVENKLEVTNAQGSYLINDNAESRESRSVRVPLVILSNPQ